MSAQQTQVLAVLGVGLLDPSTPVMRADDAGVTRGDGCFEGCRLLVRDGAATIAKLDAHLRRMARSAAALGIAFDESAWRALIELACVAWTGGEEAAVKLLLTRGPAGAATPTGFVAIAGLPADYARQRRDGIKIATLARGYASDAFAAAPWLLGGVKTLSYAINMAAQREGERRGADDIVFVSSDGVVLEAPTGSVVWAFGDTLHTTPVGDTGILAGTTQELLFERAPAAGWTTSYTCARVDDLHAADAVWVLSSVRGPVEVVQIDGRNRVRNPAADAAVKRLCGF